MKLDPISDFAKMLEDVDPELYALVPTHIITVIMLFTPYRTFSQVKSLMSPNDKQ